MELSVDQMPAESLGLLQRLCHMDFFYACGLPFAGSIPVASASEATAPTRQSMGVDLAEDPGSTGKFNNFHYIH